MIVSTNYDEIVKITNFMIDLFRRYDDSATDIKQSDILSNNFIFHYTAIDKFLSPEATKFEGGMRAGYINILYCYSRKTQDNGRF